MPVEEFLHRNKMEKIFIVDSDMFRRGERVRDGGTVDLQCSNCKQSSSRISLEHMIELQCFRSLKFKEKNFFHNCNGKLGNFTKDALYLGHCSIPEWSEEIAFLT